MLPRIRRPARALAQDVSLAEGTRLTDIVVGHIADQARRTAKAREPDG